MIPIEEAIQQFTQDAVRRDRLAAILADPVFTEAVALTKRKMEPKKGGSAEAATVIAASYFHQVAGANHLITELHDLTAPPVEKKTPRTRPPLAQSEADLPKSPQ